MASGPPRRRDRDRRWSSHGSIIATTVAVEQAANRAMATAMSARLHKATPMGKDGDSKGGTDQGAGQQLTAKILPMLTPTESPRMTSASVCVPIASAM